MFRRRKFVFDDEAKQVFLEHLEHNGLVGKAAKHAGTIQRIVTAEAKADPEFSEALDEAMLLYCESLEEEIHRRGTVGIEEEIFYKGEPIASKTVYSDQLLIFETKAKIEKYGDRSKQEVNITGGVLLAAAPAATAQQWLKAQETRNQLPPPPSTSDSEEYLEDERIIDVGSREPVPA